MAQGLRTTTWRTSLVPLATGAIALLAAGCSSAAAPRGTSEQVKIFPVLSRTECGQPAPQAQSLRIPSGAAAAIKKAYASSNLTSISGSLDPCDPTWAVFHVRDRAGDGNYGYLSKASGHWTVVDSGSAMVGASTVPPLILTDLGGSPGVFLNTNGTTTSCGKPRPAAIGSPNTLPSTVSTAIQASLNVAGSTVVGTIDPCDPSWAVFEILNQRVGNAYGYLHREAGKWVELDDGSEEVGWSTVPTQVLNDLPTHLGTP